jgi:hypothetical protein
VPNPPTDAWNQILQWLQGIIIPDWSGLIHLLPVLVILGLTGPILTLLLFYWLYHFLIDRRGRVRTAEIDVRPAERGPDGAPIFPVNTPYCIEHELVFPPTARECSVDGDELTVRCPVDDSVRVATQQLCRVCGTRYQLGAAVSPVVVQRRHGPPEGGAAIA